jgi:hypothetical protein
LDIPFILYADMPAIFGSIFVLVGLATFLNGLDAFFYRSTADVSPRGVTVSGGDKYFSIYLLLNTRKILLGKYILGQRSADYVVRQIETALGKTPIPPCVGGV